MGQVYPPFGNKLQFDSPYVSEYFGLWLIEPTAIQSMVAHVKGTNLHMHIKSEEAQQRVRERDSREYEVDRDGIAYFSLDGPMMKSVPSMAAGTSYVRLRQQLAAARRDDEVVGGLLISDTPGGTVRGNEDAAAELARFAADKPLFAYVEDMTASAGVSLVSQATKRYANNDTALYGSMGTYAVIEDLSGRAEQLGIEVHVIRAGEFKGMGTPGTPVTEQQLEELQRVVNSMNENYLSLIASGLGRSVESVRPMADGRTIMAIDAVDAGLIDGVQSLEATKQELVDTVSAKTSVSVIQRSDSVETQPATLSELKAAFPNSTAEWRETQLEAGNDIGKAAIAYAQFVEAKAEQERQDHAKALADAEAKAAAPAAAVPGHEPLTVSGAAAASDFVSLGESDSAVDQFETLVLQVQQRSGCSRQDAVTAVRKQYPEIAQSYVLATNQGNPRATRELNERFARFKKTTA